MLIELVEQGKIQLPQSCDMFGLKNLSPNIVLTQMNRPPYEDPHFFNYKVQQQRLVKINIVSSFTTHGLRRKDFEGKIPDNPISFWSKIKIYSIN